MSILSSLSCLWSLLKAPATPVPCPPLILFADCKLSHASLSVLTVLLTLAKRLSLLFPFLTSSLSLSSLFFSLFPRLSAEKMSTEIFLSAHFLVLWPVSTLFLCYLNIFSKVVGKLCQSDPVEYNHTIIDFLQKKGKTRKNQRNFDPQVWIMIKTFNGIQYIDVWPCWDRADRLMSFKECSAFTSWYKIQNPA